ncbi:hypothetical protein [Vibrio sp. CAU 1672]|uniref:hypothetical protein n=1 Tax=Vibrio sp. CAU 1672 TaxID=3032594 RepID=UPI0023DA8C42|nr:hypothetical protein [Vibrio sp. CAU 1672]MDF2153834.1 hypothetical protein [Vibrio sp. CAU 1672]
MKETHLLTAFDTPAWQGKKDLEAVGMPELASKLDKLWSAYVDGWTQSAIQGNPWSDENNSDRSNYQNPLGKELGPVFDRPVYPACIS